MNFQKYINEDGDPESPRSRSSFAVSSSSHPCVISLISYMQSEHEFRLSSQPVSQLIQYLKWLEAVCVIPNEITFNFVDAATMK